MIFFWKSFWITKLFLLLINEHILHIFPYFMKNKKWFKKKRNEGKFCFPKNNYELMFQDNFNQKYRRLPVVTIKWLVDIVKLDSISRIYIYIYLCYWKLRKLIMEKKKAMRYAELSSASLSSKWGLRWWDVVPAQKVGFGKKQKKASYEISKNWIWKMPLRFLVKSFSWRIVEHFLWLLGGAQIINAL